MKETLKRLTCMLLAMIMVAGMFPVSVFAEAENPISVDAGSTVSNVIGPIGAPETSQEPVVQTPVEEVVVEEPVEEIPEAPAFDTTKPIKYKAAHSEPFSVLKVLVDAGAPVNAITNLTGELAGKADVTPIGGDWRLTPYNYFDSVELSVTATDATEGEEAVYTVILSNPDPYKPVPMPPVTLTATVDNTIIIVDAPEGAFPEGIQLRAVKGDPADLLLAALEEIGYSGEEAVERAQMIIDSGVDLSAYIQNFDMTFYLPEEPEREIEPEKEVEVRFENLPISTEDVAVFHVGDDSVEKLESETNGTDVITFVPSFTGPAILNVPGFSLMAASVNWPQDLIDRARELYNDKDGTETPVEVVVIGPEDDTQLAGDTLTYTIKYLLATSANWGGAPYSGTESLFDNYRNAYLEIKLPAGLLLQDAALEIVSADPNNRDLTVQHTYKLKLSEVLDPATGNYIVPPSAQPTTATMNIFIGNNGTDSAISLTDYDLSDMVTLHAEFDIVNKLLDPSDPDYVVATYSKTATDDGYDFGTTSPDVWSVVKANAEGSPSYSLNTNPKTVTFTWEIGVGLLDDNNNLITDTTKYTRLGRDEVTSMTLKDTLGAVFSKTNLPVDPMTVKIQKEGGSEVTITDKIGQELTVWGDGADPALTLATQDNPYIDSDGDGRGDQNPPIYTKYTVTATYEITDDMIADFHESVYNITAKNEADTKATLARIPNVQEGHGEDTKVAPLVSNTPASLQISKTLRKYGGKGTTGRDVPYTGSNVIYGDVTYTLTAADGNSFTVYKYNSSSSSYEEFSTGTSATLTAGDVYYLDAGRDFYVTENIDPNYANDMKFVSVTPADSADPTRAKFTATSSQQPLAIAFLNKECKGYVVVNKNDGNPNHKLDNAVFSLTPANGGTAYTLTTVNGVASVDNLPFGTYVLAEESAPTGYAKQDTENGLPKTIIIGDGNGENEAIKHEFTFKNLETKAKIELKKYVGITQASTDDFTQVSQSGYPATFVLYRRDANGVVSTVSVDYKGNAISTSLNAGGEISAEVPAADPDGHPYTYYFVETLTEDGAAIYYPVNKNGLPIDPAKSDEVQLVDEDGKVKPATVSMYNRQKIIVQVFKNFYHYDTSGSASISQIGDDRNKPTSGIVPTLENMTIPVTLYRWDGTGATDGNGNPNSISQLENLGTKNAKTTDTEARWENYPAYGPNGAYTYYILEDLANPTGSPTNAAGYSFDGVDTSLEGKTIVEIGGQRYVKIDFSTAKSTYQARLYNYQKAVPVHVLKRNSITNATSVTNCKVTVYTDPACREEDIAKDAQNGKPLKDLLIPNNGTGATFFLEEGKTYYYKETVVTDGFKFDHADTDDSSVTVVNGGVIVFTAVTHGSVQYKGYTIYNEPQPQLRINKKNAASTSSNVTGAEFTVYVKNTATGEYVTYPIGGTATVITRTNANSGVRVLPSSKLPEGYEGYYFHESKVPDGYLNPNSQTAAAEYTRLDTTNTYIYDAASGKTFVKGVVNDLTGTSDTQTFTFYNIPMKGNLTVQKTVYGATQRTSGFNVVVTGNDGSEPKQAKTDGNGVATFENLPVYDSQGNKITYTIKEGEPSTWDGDLAETYYKVKDGQTVQLEAGKTTSKDADNNPLTVDNARYIKVSATKYRQNGYMSTHGTAFGYAMDGVTIGLYRRLEGETTWEPVLDSNNQPITGETAQGGNISFDKLPRTNADGTKKYEYALVELNSNSSVYLPYQNGFKQTPAAGASLTDLTPYNAVILSSGDITNTKDEYDLDDLMNSSHWVQFHVTKLLDDTTLTENLEARAADPTLPIDENGHHTQIDENDKPLSDCIFSLYRYVLTDADIAAGSVTFDKDTWAYLGTYSSGTLLNEDDKILAGQFLTVIDEGLTDANGNVIQGVNERYVYMLVEDSVGPNSAIPNPHFEYTFWHNNKTTVSCPQASQSLGYDLDTVNHGDVLNSKDKGPGPGNIILAALRLSKWSDEPDDNGNMIYKPLENATFEVSLPDGSVIAQLTSSQGVNPRKPYAYAQTGVYQLVFDDNETPNDDTDDKILMREYEVEGGDPIDYDVTDYVIEQQVQIGDKTGNVYLVPVSVRETGAPEGYGFSMFSFETYMVFCDKDPGTTGNSFRFFSDLFLTTTSGRSDFELAEDHAGEPYYYAVDADASSTLVIKDHDQLRIVDRVTVNTSVGIHKVGYVPVASGEGSTLGLNSQQIATGNYDAHGLYGVTMTLERYDTEAKQWRPWNADEDKWGTSTYTFSTNRDGDASFTNGLPQGEYRIKETSIGTENSAYENAYPGTNDRYRTFTVGPVPLIVYMANPEKIDFSLKKIDMDGNALGEGFKFKLGSSEKSTDGNGIVTWTDLATGTYTLSETAAPNGYATRYFAKLFAEKYPALASLVGSGMTLGYTYSVVDGDVVITAVTPWDQASTQVLSVEIPNPVKTNVSLKKVDKDDPTKGLSGATFTIFYKYFDTVSGDLVVTLPAAKPTLEETLAQYAGWDSLERTVGNSGQLNFNNCDPGVFVFVETTVPEGYELLKDDHGNVVVYTAVVTGKVPYSSVTVNPATSTTVDNADFQTVWIERNGATISFNVPNVPMATLKAAKVASTGLLQGDDVKDWEVTLNLYDAATGGNKVGTITIPKNNPPDNVYFKDPNDSTKNALFSVDKTYYLEEVVNVTDGSADAAHFIIVSYKVGEGTVIPVQPGSRYEVPVDSAQGFTITVTNQYLYGKVDFVKRNSANPDDLSKMAGATFEVRHKVTNPEDPTAEKWEKIPGSEVIDNGDGSYTAKLPLDSASATTYRIYELTPPPGFVMNPNEENTYIEVQLSAENNYVDYRTSTAAKETVYNTEGVKLNLLKYDNIHGATTISPADGNAKFAVYEWDGDNNSWKEVQNEWVYGADAGENQGKMPEFVMRPFATYALAEIDFDHAAYSGFDGYYQDGVKLRLQELTGVTVGDKPVYGVILNGTDGQGVTEPVTLVAYNVPKVSPTIEKKDVGKYPEGVFAMADFSIYEVAADFVANRENVEALLADTSVTPIITGSTSDTVTFDDGLLGSTAKWEGSTPENTWNPAKTYLIVETEVAGSGGTYDTMVKDDKRVTWFVKTEPVADPDPKDPPVWTLENINGVADVELKKDVDVTSVETLLSGSRDVVYTITPTVTGKNQMLTSFVLTESGITAEPERATFDYDITNVTIGGASQIVTSLETEGTSLNAKIKADITFYSDLALSAAAKRGEETVDVTDGSQSVTVPADTKTFTIRYYSEEVQRARPGYDLGEEFKADPTTVAVTVKQIPAGSYGDPAVEITKFTNKANVELHYPKWGADGSEPTDQKEDDEKTVDVAVEGIKLPIVSVEKSDNLEGKAAKTGTMIQYSLTFKNSDKTEEIFHDPVLVDILPTGVKFKMDETTYPVGITTGTQGEIIKIESILPTEGDVKQQVETPEGLYGDPETAVIFMMSGDLLPGSSVTVTFWAEVMASALLYQKEDEEDIEIRNDVYLSSSKQSYFTENNRNGYSFAVSTGPTSYGWGKTLPNAAQDPNDPVPAIHEAGVHSNVLGLLSDPDQIKYAFVRAADIVKVVQGATLGLSKGVYGDRDDGFHDTGLGWCSRTKLYSDEQDYEKGDEGWALWRLTINNGETEDATELVIGDVIPKFGDDDNRNSSWNMIFDSFDVVKANGVELTEGTDYTVWYYNGGQQSSDGVIPDDGWTYEAKTRVRTDVAHAREDGYLASHGWFTGLPASREDRAQITAFIMVFNEKGDLPGSHSMVVTYKTIVEKVDEERFNEIAFTNATNDFWIYYEELRPLSPINSNPVDVSLMDTLVQVEGDVWIDEDWDAEQEEGGNRRNYSEYAIINQLANAISFTITDKSGSGLETDSEDADHGSNTNPGYGESVRHFVFSDLFPAKHLDGIPLYINEELNVASLKGKDPARYVLNSALDTQSLTEIFKLTDLGDGHYMSDDPDTELTADAPNSLDCNFFGVGDSETQFITKPFYIRYSDLWDQSKDIGFRMVRDLVITKVAQDNPGEKIKGAEFQIYGPFDEGEATEATGEPVWFSESNGVYTYVSVRPGEQPPQDTSKLTRTLVTDENGQITVKGINWWKEYVIKETKAGAGYNIEGATATATENYDTNVVTVEGQPGVFIVKLPSKDRVTKPDGVTIANPRGVPEVPYVKKVIEGTPLEDETFEFTLDFADDMDDDLKEYVKFKNASTGKYDNFTVPQTKTLKIIANGAGRTEPFFDAIDVASDDFDETTLKKIWFLVKGTYKFVITETKGDNTNYAYDPAVWYYTVTVDLVDGQLVATHTYTYKENADSEIVKPQDQTAAKFTNKYTPKPVDGNLKVKKVIDGTQIPDFKERTDLDVTFEFELKPVGDAPMTLITRNPDGTETTTPTAPVKVYIKASEAAADPVDFGLITFTKAGTYQYTITETADVNGDYPWFTFDPTTITATVTVEPDTTAKPGKLKISNIEYEPNVWTSADDNTTAAKFTNTYTPGEVPFTATAQKTFESYTDAKFTFTFELYRDTISSGTKLQEKKIYNVSGDPINGTITLEPVSFDAVTITGAGEYTFIVKEQALDEKTKVICSEEVYTYVVTASWDTATRKLIISKMDVTDKEGHAVESPYYAEFINKYDLTAYWPPVVSKVLTGRPMGTDEVFEFVVEKDGKKVADGTFNANGIVSITYYQEDGTAYPDQPNGVPYTIADVSRSPYTYTIKEINRGDTAQSGITYDGNPITATVNITEERDNEDKPYLEVTANYSPDAQFENIFNASGEWTPEVTKELTGRDLKKDEFTFVLEVKKTDGTWETLQTVTNNKDGTVPFTAITYNEQQTGVYDYQIREVIPNPPEEGMTYAQEPISYTVTVALHRNSDGTYSNKLDVDDVLNSQGTIFINTFEHKPITSTLKVQKKITGQWPTKVPAETFTFEMTLTSGNADNVKLKDGDNYVAFSKRTVPLTPAELNTYVVKSFDDIWFMNAGEYVFTVKEEEGSDPHFAYDPSVYTWTVKVTKDTAGTGQLSKTEELKKGEEVIPGDPLTVSFDNPYTPEPVEVPFKVKKILDGETMSQLTDTQLKAITFTFVLEEHGGNTNKDGYELPKDPTDMTVQISAYEILKEGVNFKEFPGKVKFTEASPVDEDGKPIPYIFTIHEEDTQGPDGTPSSRIYHDSTTWYVSVVIVDNSGKLEVEKDYPEYKATGRTTSYGLKDGIAYFTNTYSPDKTQYTPKVKKVMDGDPRVPKIERDFTFNLKYYGYIKPGTSSLIREETDGYYYVDPQGTTVVIHDQGTAPFTEIVFKKISTYIFEIQEKDDRTQEEIKKNYYYFDLAPRYLRVEVSDRGDGSLKCDAHYFMDPACTEPARVQANIPEIINEYHPLPAKYAPPIEKTLITNYGPTVKEKKFTFTLQALTSLPSDGSDMAPGTTKELPVEIPKGETVVPDDQTKTFGEITYTKPGEYKYLITETIVNEHGITCSTVNWTLTVTVTDGGGQLVAAHLYEPSSGPDTANTEQAKFKNDYKPEPTYFTPKATKTLTVDFGPTVAEKIFTFDLKLENAVAIHDDTVDVKDGASIQSETKQVTVAAGEDVGEVLFSKIEFTKAGTYTYTIQEETSSEEGIADDTAVKTLEIVVTDPVENDGNLYISKYTYSTGETDSADWDTTPPLDGLKEGSVGNEVTNVYVPTPTEFTPKATKTLTVDFGPTIAKKTFTFDLKLDTAVAIHDKTVDVKDGADIQSETKQVTVTAGEAVGDVLFSKITFTKAGTYTYTIQEQASGEEGIITEDTAKKTLEIVVKDKDGALYIAKYTYSTGETRSAEPDDTPLTGLERDTVGNAVTNVYKPDPTKYAPQVYKEIVPEGGPTSADKTFTFDLTFKSAKAIHDPHIDVSDGQLDAKEEDGGTPFKTASVEIKIPAGKTKAEPETASFKEIHFTKAGWYTYEITEHVSYDLGMTYDRSHWTLIVEVRDQDGSLKVVSTKYSVLGNDAIGNGSRAEFFNPYATGNLRVEKRVSGSGASTMTKFKFTVYLYTENPITGVRTNLPGEYPLEIYDSKGNVVETSMVTVETTGKVEFSLRHNQYAIIKDIPVGAKWEVVEEKYTGYASSAETPNKGTIQRGDNISKWKNHRSTVPPIPRTGYGDGTTVKVGLGTSLGVFLASAIGSILQSKNSKKKKRGGGSHAAN